MGDSGAGIVILLVGAAFYFLPAIIAASQKKRDAGAIFVLNLLLGWTVIGWIIALVWAAKTDVPPVTIVQQQFPQPAPPQPAVFCSKCGVYSPPGSAFCSRCGGDLRMTAWELRKPSQ
ncbi:MAG: superinfection immunity protein [Candidatus Acidiferrales bacterium]